MDVLHGNEPFANIFRTQDSNSHKPKKEIVLKQQILQKLLICNILASQQTELSGVRNRCDYLAYIGNTVTMTLTSQSTIMAGIVNVYLPGTPDNQ